jgi:hypothetical protein
MSSTKTNTWISVDKKEPPFDEKMLLFSKGGDDWDLGHVERRNNNGRENYRKILLAGEDVERIEGYKFWMKPEPPTK